MDTGCECFTIPAYQKQLQPAREQVVQKFSGGHFTHGGAGYHFNLLVC